MLTRYELLCQTRPRYPDQANQYVLLYLLEADPFTREY